MAKKDDLRNQREGTVINTTSKRQEKELDRALEAVSTMVRQSTHLKCKLLQKQQE